MSTMLAEMVRLDVMYLQLKYRCSKVVTCGIDREA